MDVIENNQKIVNAIGIRKGYPKDTIIDIKNADQEILTIEGGGAGTGGNAQPSDVLEGKTFTNDSGSQIGTIPTYSGSNVVYPSASGTILSTNGNYLTSDISVRGDANFKAENIKKGVTIWGITGTLEVSVPYTPLIYLETNGTNYIDTLFKPNAKTTKLIYKTKFIEVSNAAKSVLGARNGQEKSTNCSILMNRGTLRLDWVGDSNTALPHTYINQIYEIELQDNIAKVDGVQYGGIHPKKDIYINDSIVLGRIKDNGTILYEGVKQEIYSCKIYDNGSLVRNMIPCEYIGQKGLWDKVEDEFYPLIG